MRTKTVVAVASVLLSAFLSRPAAAECRYPKFLSRQTWECVSVSQCLPGAAGEPSCTNSVPPSCACNTSTTSSSPPTSGKPSVGDKSPPSAKPTRCPSGYQLVCSGGDPGCSCKKVGGKGRVNHGKPKKGGSGKGNTKGGGGATPRNGGSARTAPVSGGSSPSAEPSRGAASGSPTGGIANPLRGTGGGPSSGGHASALLKETNQASIDARLTDPKTEAECTNAFNRVANLVAGAYNLGGEFSTCEYRGPDDPGCGAGMSPSDSFLERLARMSPCFEVGALNCSLLKAVLDSLSVAGVKCLASAKTPEEKSRCEELYTSFTQAIDRVSCGGGEDSQSDNGAGAGVRPNGDNALDGSSSSESPLLAIGSASCANVAASLGNAIGQFFAGPVMIAVCPDRTKPNCGRQSPRELLSALWMTANLCRSIDKVSVMIPSVDRLKGEFSKIVAEEYRRCLTQAGEDRKGCDAARDEALDAIGKLS